MANRFQIKQHELAYKFIAERDGEQCLICGSGPTKRNPLEIDHADANVSNWEPDNLHLLCKRCNLEKRAMSPKKQRRMIERYSANNVCEREKKRGVESTQLARSMVDYTSGSVEMQANSIYELRFREWLLEQIEANGFAIKKEAVYSGAEAVGCSPVTVTRYLSKLTSSVGNLVEEKGPLGVKVVRFKR